MDISKVEVVVNSGKVVHTWNDPAELAKGILSVTLDPDYSYYFIRVTQGDGDLAVTSPVWVGDTLKLGVSNLVSGTATPVTNEELTLTATLFNSEDADATVKSLTYTIGDEVIGTDTTGHTVAASSKILIGDIMLLIPGLAMTNAVRDTMVGSPISGAMRLIETLLWAGALAMGFMSAFLLMGGIGL